MQVQEIKFEATNDFKSLVLHDMALRQRQLFLQFHLQSSDDLKALVGLLNRFDVISQIGQLIVTCSVSPAILPILKEQCFSMWHDWQLNEEFESIEQQHTIFFGKLDDLILT